MIRIGHGFDIHRLAPERVLVLGGVIIPWDTGLLGHSDADVLLHAAIDGILGALALGDIGQWFPDTDERFRGADSAALLRAVMRDPRLQGWDVANLDATILAERPKLAPHIPTMRESIARILSIPADRVSVKATTMEGIGEIGQSEAIAAHAVVLLNREPPLVRQSSLSEDG